MLEPFQEMAVDWLSSQRRAILVSPAGSGKTIMAAAALEKVLKSRTRTSLPRIGWMAHTVEQIQQAKDACAKFPGIQDKCSISFRCAADNRGWEDSHALLVDECHYGGSPLWRRQIESCDGARWGFTATPWTDDEDRNDLLSELFGNRLRVVSRDETEHRIVPARVILMDAFDPGRPELIDRKIERLFTVRKTWWRGSEWELRAIVAWQACLKHGIAENSSRNRCAVSIARKHLERGDSILVLVNTVEHGKLLQPALESSVLCHSKMPRGKRAKSIEAFKAGTIKCLVTTSMLEEGFDAPIAKVLIVLSGGRSERKAEQTTGRVLRKWAGKAEGIIYDFIDSQHPLMARHAKRRIRTYARLGYRLEYPTQQESLI